MTPPVQPDAEAQALLERVRALVPQLRASSRATEEHRDVLTENIDALEAAGAFRLTIPKSRGGYEADLSTVAEVLAEISRGDPSTGWVACLVTFGNWWAGIMPDEVADEMFATPGLRTAGVITPTATATPVDGGYKVSGRWQWNTGSGIANWGGFAAMAQTPDGVIPLFCIIPYSDLTVLHDWDAWGLAGTGSGTTVADDVFVPAIRTLLVPDLVNGKFPERALSGNPYYNRPAVQLFSAGSTGPLIGMARGAMDVFMERLPGRKITYTNYATQAEASLTHTQVAEATFDLEVAEHFVDAANRTVEDYWGRDVPLESRLRTRAYVGQVAKYARSSVTTLFQASGATAVTNDVAIQRYFRDVHALANHALLQPTTATELLGRHLVGLEPNSVFF
jgi:alkylation response protein AidB-like acyl-CoA dehydrogenase